jgi:hypothetical protein
LGPRSDEEAVPTDREEDSAYACILPLIGVEIASVYYHNTTVSAWIDPDCATPFTQFHVPKPGYDPREHKDAVMCQSESCLETPLEDGGGPHVIVPEGFYTPPFDEELYEQVRGKQVEIFFHNIEVPIAKDTWRCKRCHHTNMNDIKECENCKREKDEAARSKEKD